MWLAEICHHRLEIIIGLYNGGSVIPEIFMLSVKQQITKELSRDIVCIFEIINGDIHILLYNKYIKVLLNKIDYSSFKCSY